jgi:predicted AlkP superfamily pyrophosphatase or phosphodiesterase
MARPGGRRVAPVALALLLAACGAARPAPDPGPRTVVLISLDGFRYDYPARVPTPAFERMAREGAHVGRLRPIFPSTTFPNHAALATGVTADHHGIVNNQFVDPDQGRFAYGNEVRWYDVPPLWIVAEQHGLRTFVLHWIGIVGAWHGVSAAVGVPFDPKTTDDQKVDRILEWLRLPEDQRPRLIMSYFAGCDHDGHAHGPDSPEVTRCIGATDARLGRLLAGVDPGRTTILVVSDHGMENTVGEIDPDDPFIAAKVPAQVVAVGPIAHVYLASPDAKAQALAIAHALPHVTVYERDALPPELHYRHPKRTGDLVLLADPGWDFIPERGDRAGPPLVPGSHGFSPDLPEMGAVFYAWGAGVRPGAVDAAASNLDVVPTVCRLLGIDPPAYAEGHALTDLLE